MIGPAKPGRSKRICFVEAYEYTGFSSHVYVRRVGWVDSHGFDKLSEGLSALYPGFTRVLTPENTPWLSARVNDIRIGRVQSKDPYIHVVKTKGIGRPVFGPIDGFVYPVPGSGIQGVRMHGVDDQAANHFVDETAVHFLPGLTAIFGFENSRAFSSRIHDLVVFRMNDHGPDSQIGNAVIHCFPIKRTIFGFEYADLVCSGVEQIGVGITDDNGSR